MKQRMFFILMLTLILTISDVFGQTDFVEYPENPVLQGTPDSWDAFVMLRGCVIYADGQYHMYYSAEDTPWSGTLFRMDIGYASSMDGITWEKHPFNPIFTYNRFNWEKNGFNDVSVLKIGKKWHMWYNTLPRGLNEDSFELGYASSSDGLSWQKHEERLDFDASDGDWDAGYIAMQDVIYNGEKFMMYYIGATSWSAEAIYEVGVAESEDGINWTKDTLNNPVITSGGPGSYKEGVWALDVLYDENNTEAPYQMWYTGYNSVSDRVFYAKSDDGKNWIEDVEPLFVYKKWNWGTFWAEDMEVVCVDSSYQMWMYGFNGNSTWGAGLGYFWSPTTENNSNNTIFVPTDYPIIQDAINAADTGDVVIIEEGTYYQQFSFEGKAITVGSRYVLDQDTSHISKTIIDGSFLSNPDSASLVYFATGENSNSVLCGLTLQNGKGTKGESGEGFEWLSGGAISVLNSGATIKNNIIKNCSCNAQLNLCSGGAIDCFVVPKLKTIIIKENRIINNELKSKNLAMGAGINCEGIEGKLIIDKNIIQGNKASASAIAAVQGNGSNGSGLAISGCESDSINVSNNFIHNNSVLTGTYNDGGGMAIFNSSVHVHNNIITENSCLGPSRGRGGGITVGYWDWGDTLTSSDYKVSIVNNTIVNNKAQHSAGGIYVNNLKAEIVNNIIRENKDPLNYEINLYGTATSSIVNYCNVKGGFEGEGNIDADPQFCDSTFCLLTKDISPCIDAGNPDMAYNDVLDGFNVLYPAYGSQRNDMGAFGGAHSKWWEKDMQLWDPTTTVDNEFVVIPAEYKLSQNYPNPFNPSTVIEYDVPNESIVTLKIFDILGREVKTLVKENQKPGTYKIAFNAIGLTSGVYFYKILAGDFVDTKKMVLLR